MLSVSLGSEIYQFCSQHTTAMSMVLGVDQHMSLTELLNDHVDSQDCVNGQIDLHSENFVTSNTTFGQ